MLNEFVLTKDSICPKQFVRLKFVRNLKVQNKTSDFFLNKCVPALHCFVFANVKISIS